MIVSLKFHCTAKLEMELEFEREWFDIMCFCHNSMETLFSKLDHYRLQEPRRPS